MVSLEAHLKGRLVMVIGCGNPRNPYQRGVGVYAMPFFMGDLGPLPRVRDVGYGTVDPRGRASMSAGIHLDSTTLEMPRLASWE